MSKYMNDDNYFKQQSQMSSSMLKTTTSSPAGIDTFKDKINPNSSLYKSLNNSFINSNNNNNSTTNTNDIIIDNKELITLQKDIDDYLNLINEEDNENNNNNDDDSLTITFLSDANDALKKQQLYIKQLEKQLKQDKNINNNLKSQSIELSSTEKELSDLKIKYNDLERNNKLLITKTVEARLELENSEKVNQSKIANKNQEIEELTKKIKFISNNEKELEKQLKESENKYSDLERNTQLKIKAIEKEKTQCRTEIVELKHKSTNQSDLTNLKKSKDSEIQHLLSQNKKLEDQILSQKKTLNSTLKLLSEKEKELELINSSNSNNNNNNSNNTSSSNNQNNLDNEKLIQSFKSENNYLKQINNEQKLEIERLNKIFEGVGNLEMIKQANQNMKEKIKRLEPLIEKYNNLQVEYSNLLNDKKSMELNFGTFEKQQNAQQLQQKITQLENENQTLVGKIGEVTANWKLMENRNQDFDQRFNQLKESTNEKDLKINELIEKIKRIEKLNYLLNRERDNIKNILDAHDNQIDDNNNNNNGDNLLKIERINELERALKEKNILIQDYEYKLDCGSSNSSSNNGDFTGIDYREECKKLNKDIEKLLQENALLEARLGKGEFDPTKTKVLHFSNNPSSILNVNNNNNSSSNNDNNNNSNSGNGSLDTDKKLIEENHRLYIQINDSEKKMDRLKQIFRQKINEFREAVYVLLGFKIDVDANNRYKLQSMYAERETDFLIFQQTTNNTGNTNSKLSGQMELLETDFTKNLDKEIKAYLFTCKSIPSFLSQVTIELFSRQTFHS